MILFIKTIFLDDLDFYKCRKRGKNMKLSSKMENYYTNKVED